MFTVKKSYLFVHFEKLFHILCVWLEKVQQVPYLNWDMHVVSFRKETAGLSHWYIYLFVAEQHQPG